MYVTFRYTWVLLISCTKFFSRQKFDNQIDEQISREQKAIKTHDPTEIQKR